MVADDEDAVVPELGGSLTSVTWNEEELMDVFDADIDKSNIVVAGDNWGDATYFVDDFAINSSRPVTNVSLQLLQSYLFICINKFLILGSLLFLPS